MLAAAVVALASLSAAGPAEDPRLVDARRLEANFETEQANRLRQQILDEFAADAAPSPALREAAGRAAYEIALAHFSEKGPDVARKAARSAAQNFFDAPLDSLRFPPAALAFFQTIRDDVHRDAKPVRLRCAQPGHVFIEGTNAGFCRGELSVPLLPGPYRAWLERRGALSPLVPFVAPLPAGQDLVVGDPPSVQAQPGSSGAATDAPPSAAEYPAFSAAYLVPLGVGQFYQRRFVWGGVFAAAELGLAGWLVAASLSTGAASQNGDTEAADFFATQRNIAAISLGVVAAAGIVEAIVTGATSGN